MRHLQLAKSLYRSVGALPAVKSGSVSLGAAGHTLTVRSLQLIALLNSTVGLQYAPLGEREAVYPVKGYAGRAAVQQLVRRVQLIADQLADNRRVQLAQITATGEYRLRYTRCSLTDGMRRLNEALPEFDFDPFTANILLRCIRGTPVRQEALLRLHGLPVRVGRHSRDLR